LVAGGALVLALSASDAAVLQAPPVVLATSAVEIAGDSTTSVSWIFLPNTSWPEAFLPLFDVGGALLMNKYLSQTKIQELGCEAKQKAGLLTWLPT
jgi:hypothetical protein